MLSLRSRTVGRAPGPKPRDHFITGDGLHPAAFQVVIAPVKRFPRTCKIAQVFLDDILYKRARVAASSLRQYP